MPIRALTPLAAAVLVPVLLLAGCQDPGATDPREPRAPAYPGAPPSPAASPPGEPGIQALVGNARVEDPAGDVLDDAGRPPPQPVPAADLRAVQLHGDGSRLRVTFELDGPVPPAAGDIVWSLEIIVDDEPAYSVTAQLLGGRLVAAVFDWSAGEQVALPDDPAVDEAQVVLTVPAALLERIDGPFRWLAIAQLDGGYEDTAPGDPADPASFPGG